MGRAWILLLVAVFGLAFLSAGRAVAQEDPTKSAKVTEQDKIEFKQRKVNEHMKELEGRMFKLSELISKAEPDNARRLLRALEKSKEGLIVEDMDKVLAELRKSNLPKVSTESKELIKKLEELRELLVSTDLDLLLQLDRLKKLEEALKDVDKLITEQGRENNEAGRLDQQQKEGKVDPRDIDQLKKDQEGNRKSTDSLKEKLKGVESQDGKAGQKLDEASKEMKGSEGKLSESKPGEAKPKGGEAKKNLEDAKKDLQRQRDELKKEIEEAVRAAVMADLNDMLERQRRVRTATEELGARQAKGADMAVEILVKRLALDEREIVKIMKRTVQLVEDVNFSVTLPAALKSVQRQMIYVVIDLNNGLANEKVVEKEKKIEADLESLIKAMEEQKKQSAPPKESPQQQQQRQKKQEMMNLLGELRMLRMLQIRVNEESLSADAKRAPSEDLSDDLKEMIGNIRDHQKEARDIADLLEQKANPRRKRDVPETGEQL